MRECIPDTRGKEEKLDDIF